MLAFLAPL